jgi:integrase
MATVTLTPSFVKSQLHCPPDKKRVEFCDATFPGLYVEARATSPGQGTYYLRYKNMQGKTTHVKLGRTTELTLAQARKLAQSTKAEVLLGADPQAERKRQRQVPTFAEFAHEHYLPYIKPRKRSWQRDACLLRCHLLPAFGESLLNSITRAQVTQLHTALHDSGRAPATCDQVLILLRRMLNLAVEWELLEQNPAAKAKLFNVDNRKERYLSDEEMSRLLHILKTDRNRPVCLVILFLLSTGARVREALRMRWSDVDTEKRSWRIPAENSKSKKPRVVPLGNVALDVLKAARALHENPEHVFLSMRTGKPLTNIRMMWTRLREAAGLPDFRIHDCRHNFASVLVNNGRSLYEVQQILGHHDPKVTMRYAHLSPEALQSAANAVSATMGSLRL